MTELWKVITEHETWLLKIAQEFFFFNLDETKTMSLHVWLIASPETEFPFSKLSQLICTALK